MPPPPPDIIHEGKTVILTSTDGQLSQSSVSVPLKVAQPVDEAPTTLPLRSPVPLPRFMQPGNEKKENVGMHTSENTYVL